MSETRPQIPDEMTPELRRALVELGAVIPTTASEVELVEKHLTSLPSKAEIDTAFQAVLRALDPTEPRRSFMKLTEQAASANASTMAMAARNGGDLDAKTLAQIEQDVAAALRKSLKT